MIGFGSSQHYRHEIKKIVVSSVILSLALVVFILVFQPYDFNRLSTVILLEVVALIFTFTLISSIIYQYADYRFDSAWRNILVWILSILFISQVIYFYTINRGLNEFTWKGVGVYFVASLALSLIPFVVNLLLRHKKYILPTLKENGSFTVENLTFNKENVLLFAAEDNYVRVVFLDETNSTKTVLVRIPMKEILKKAGKKAFMRVHRSYAINLKYLLHITGNAKRYSIQVQHLNEEIPASRPVGKWLKRQFGSVHHR